MTTTAVMTKLRGKAVALPGMEQHADERAEVQALELAADLTAELRTAKGSIERKAGELETLAPLFRGTEASPQAELFPSGNIGLGTKSTDAELELF